MRILSLCKQSRDSQNTHYRFDIFASKFAVLLEMI